jgi:hypothetical protein
MWNLAHRGKQKKENGSFHIFYVLMADYGLSVRKGDAGKPSLLYRLAPSGLSAQAYLTYNGAGT